MNEEMLKKARKAKSAEELIALAKENDIELNGNQAEEYFTGMNATGELDDDGLNAVAGGCGSIDDKKCVYCGQRGCLVPGPVNASNRYYWCTRCNKRQ